MPKPQEIVQELYRAAVDIPEPFSALSEAEKRSAAKLLARYEEAVAEHGVLPHADILLPMLLGKNGKYSEALKLTQDKFQQTPNWETAVAVANAARRAGDLEAAVTMFSKASELDTNDVTCFLEVGDIRLEQDRWTEALTAYESALAKDKANQWALPSAFYCRHRLGLAGEWLASLREVANQQGCTCGMEECLTSMLGIYGASRGRDRAKYLMSKLRKTDDDMFRKNKRKK